MCEEIERLQRSGAGAVVVSRAERPAIAAIGDRVVTASGPAFDPVDRRGAGDAMVAGLAVAIGRGHSLTDALRLGMAAGTLNAIRHGLGSGHGEDVERIEPTIEIRELTDADGQSVTGRERRAGRAQAP